MVSQAKGYLRVPVWIDSGIVKPIVDNAGRIPVNIEKADISFDVNQHTYYDGEWVKQPIQFGYSDSIFERHDYTTLADIKYIMEFSPVPANEIWVLKRLVAMTSAVGSGAIDFDIKRGVLAYVLKNFLSPEQYTSYVVSDNIIMKEGDFVRITFTNTTVGADLYGWLFAYSMMIGS